MVPWVIGKVGSTLLSGGAFAQFVAMTQVAARPATAANALPFTKASTLEGTSTQKCLGTMLGEMLAPHPYGTETFEAGSFHPAILFLTAWQGMDANKLL